MVMNFCHERRWSVLAFKSMDDVLGLTNAFSSLATQRACVHAQEMPRRHDQTTHDNDVVVREAEELLLVVHCS